MLNIKSSTGLLLVLILASCRPARKTAAYYHNNKQVIAELRQLYNMLYEQQPFSLGFTDRSLKYYVAEIKTDTVRYIYNTDKNSEQVEKLVTKYHYDTAIVRQFLSKMKQAKCLWISRTTMYVDMKPQQVTVLSFKAASRDAFFKENKYYVLFFPQQALASSPGIKQKIANGEIVKIEEGVYFSITSKFR